MIERVKVALFDLDGTIIDTEPYHYQCWNSILNDLGHDIDYEHYLSTYAGVAIDQNCEKLIKTFNLQVPAGFLKQRKEELMIEILDQHALNTMTFVNEMIVFLMGNGVRLGLVTSSSKQESDLMLNKLSLKDTFECIITRDDVVNKKPHPEPYNRAREAFNLPCTEFLVFEDSFSGVKSAKNAQMRCFAIHDNIQPDSPIHVIADGVYPDFRVLKKSVFETIPL